MVTAGSVVLGYVLNFVFFMLATVAGDMTKHRFSKFKRQLIAVFANVAVLTLAVLMHGSWQMLPELMSGAIIGSVIQDLQMTIDPCARNI